MREAAQVLVDAISVGGLYALTALGIGMIFGVMRLVNFAHADLITFAGYAILVFFAQSTMPVQRPRCQRTFPGWKSRWMNAGRYGGTAVCRISSARSQTRGRRAFEGGRPVRSSNHGK